MRCEHRLRFSCHPSSAAGTDRQLGRGRHLAYLAAHHGHPRTNAGAHVPPPLTALDLFYPANLGLINSGLGLATCSPQTLEALGPEGCPPDSLMGHGSALVEIPLGPEIISETGQITTWLGPVQEGHLALLFYAQGETPIAAQLIFTSQVLEAPLPYGGNLATKIPLIPGLPEAPNAAVVQMHTTIGSQGVTYYTHSHGQRISYHPNGLRLPHQCPHHGFPFAAAWVVKVDQLGTSTSMMGELTARRLPQQPLELDLGLELRCLWWAGQNGLPCLEGGQQRLVAELLPYRLRLPDRDDDPAIRARPGVMVRLAGWQATGRVHHRSGGVVLLLRTALEVVDDHVRHLSPPARRRFAGRIPPAEPQ